MSAYREQGVVFNCGKTDWWVCRLPEISAEVGVLIFWLEDPSIEWGVIGNLFTGEKSGCSGFCVAQIRLHRNG